MASDADGNLNSAFTARFALPVMRKQKSGHVIFIGNIRRTACVPGNSCALHRQNRGAVIGKTLARGGPHGIRANVVNPGIIDTGNRRNI